MPCPPDAPAGLGSLTACGGDCWLVILADMKPIIALPHGWFLTAVLIIPILSFWSAATAQDLNASEPQNWTAAQDHKNMMEQLGITALRPGPSGRSGATNSANYDPAKANPFPDLPDPLMLKNGRKVTTPEIWWKERRPEIVEDFEREVFGRVPKSLPKVTWTVVTQATDRVVGTMPVAAKQLVGNVDNAACPSIKVGIQMTLVTPANAKGPVPVLMMFGGGSGGNGFPRRPGEPAPTNRFVAFGGGTNAGPS